jgi:hypothetical protein
MPKSITEIVAQKPQITQFSAAELQACIKGHRLTDALNFLESRGTKSETALFILSQANQECIGCGDRRVMSKVEFPEGKEHPHYQAAIRCAYCDTFRGWQLRQVEGQA